MKTVVNLFSDIVFYSYYFVLYTVIAIGIFALSGLLKSPDHKVTLELMHVGGAILLAFLFWLSNIAMGKLQEKSELCKRHPKSMIK
ncbi:MAG: hypothetical protein JWP69_2400 [Flaviaesturariibacter sp.]|nr:hypothetical protein [Flaviaesturariibacter sp.]